MLGKLTRFLRIFGYDTIYANDLEEILGVRPIPDESLADYAFKNERIIITRDYPFYKKFRTHKICLLEGENVYNYLNQLKHKLNLNFKFDIKNARCAICNSNLIKVENIDSIKNDVKPQTFKFHSEFYQCSNCKKVYWKGTHIDKIIKNLRNEKI
jgi:uncharacterized protein with PIN domain